MSDRGTSTPRTAPELYADGQLVAAARREADACERDGYHVTAMILRDLADNAESKAAHDA